MTRGSFSQPDSGCRWQGATQLRVATLRASLIPRLPTFASAPVHPCACGGLHIPNTATSNHRLNSIASVTTTITTAHRKLIVSMRAVLTADAAAVQARQHATCTSSRAALRVAQPRLLGTSTRRAAGRCTVRVAAEGNSLEASYSTGGPAGGRSGAAQLRGEPAGAAQAPLDAVATPADSGAVLQEAADYMRGELRRMFTTGVRNPVASALVLHLYPLTAAVEQQHQEDAQVQRVKQQQ